MPEDEARAKAQWTIGGNAGSIKAEAARDRSNKIQAMLSGILDDDKELINGTTVGPLAGLRLLAEAGSDWSGLDIVKPKGTELHDSLDLLKSMLWKDLVGSGQISVSDYEFLDQLLGAGGWLDTPSRVKAKLTRVQEFLQGKSRPVGTHDNTSAMAEKESGAVSSTNDPLGLR
jgi:hypothetical protein